MKSLKIVVLSLVGLFVLSLTVALGLFATGHLVFVPQHQIINYVDDKGNTMFSQIGNVIYYRIAFVK